MTSGYTFRQSLVTPAVVTAADPVPSPLRTGRRWGPEDLHSSSKAHFKGSSPPLGIPEPPGCGKGSQLVGDRNMPCDADKAEYTPGLTDRAVITQEMELA